MAAISNVQPLTPAFTKAYLVRCGTVAARVEFVFEKSTSTLTLTKVNLWESKEKVHLNITLADDLDVTPEQKIML